MTPNRTYPIIAPTRAEHDDWLAKLSPLATSLADGSGEVDEVDDDVMGGDVALTQGEAIKCGFLTKRGFKVKVRDWLEFGPRGEMGSEMSLWPRGDMCGG